MTPPTRPALTFVLWLLLAGCWQQKPSPMTATVALVNDEPITVQELQTALSETEDKGSQTIEATPEEKEELARRLLEQLIERKMLLQEARRLQIKLTEGEMQDRLSEIREGMEEEAFLRYLSEQKLTKETWEASAREMLLIEKLLNQLVGDQISLPEEELLQYYNSNLEEWSVPEQIKLRQILVETETEADAIRQSLAEGTDFVEAAQTHAQTLELGKDGDLGYRAAGELPVEFEPPAWEEFPCLRLAYRALESDRSLPIVLNGANEVAVESFLDGRLPFSGIPGIIARAMDRHSPAPADSVAAVRRIHAWARERAEAEVRELQSE